MFSEEHLYSIALRRCANIGDINFMKLVTALGSAQMVWKAPVSEIQHISGISNGTTKEIGSGGALHFAEKELDFCFKNNIKINLRHLGELPKLLNECSDAPAILYQKGSFDGDKNTVSIVGTRNFTIYGKEFLEALFEKIQPGNVATVSGLALGTDAEVHELSIAKNIPTVGILAHGFHTFYPAKNRKLSERILDGGGTLFTEFNSSHKPDRENFIQRNRIIAGLSAATIVVETAFGGGSISTATFANDYNREVYALPGKITDQYSQGCNRLISQNKAAIISSASELADILGLKPNQLQMDELFPRVEKIAVPQEFAKLYDALSNAPESTSDDLSEKLSIPSHKILSDLLNLELLGYVKSVSGKRFVVK